MKKNLLYITKIERCAARHLRRAHIAGDTAIVRDPMPWRDMCLCGLASMESETEEDEGVTTVSTTLTARLRTDISLKDEPQIFRLTTAGGAKFLLGGTRQPYAAMAKANYYPESTSETASTGITITYTDRRGPLRLIEAR